MSEFIENIKHHPGWAGWRLLLAASSCARRPEGQPGAAVLTWAVLLSGSDSHAVEGAVYKEEGNDEERQGQHVCDRRTLITR